MKCGWVKPQAYPVCAGKGSLNTASAIRQTVSRHSPGVSVGRWRRSPWQERQTLRQSRILAPVARRGVRNVSAPFTLDVPGGAETSFFASTAKSVS